MKMTKRGKRLHSALGERLKWLFGKPEHCSKLFGDKPNDTIILLKHHILSYIFDALLIVILQ